MVFEKRFTDRLFVAQDQSGDRGFIAWAIPPNTTPPSDPTVSLKTALENTSYMGTFVFSAIAPKITDKQSADDFVKAVFSIVPASTRQCIWTPDPSLITADTVFMAQIAGDGSVFQTGLDTILTSSLIFQIQSGMRIRVDDDDSALLLNGSGNNFRIGFSGPSAPDMKPVITGSIPFTGSLRGCVQFNGFIQRTSLYEKLQWGFQCVIPNPNGNGNDTPPLSEWLPLADPNVGPTDYLGFAISIDPNDPYNEVFDPCVGNACTMAEAYASRRTFFDFTGLDFMQGAVTLASFYRTTFGAGVTLIPGTPANAQYNARLVINLGERVSNTLQNFEFAPEGDFILSFPSTAGLYNNYLQCGQSGTEFFTVTPQSGQQNGDILRLISRKPAYAPDFPFQTASPVGPPNDPTASPFNTTFRTSWGTIVNNSGKTIRYVSQPKGSALFGNDPLIEPTFTDLFGHTIPGFVFTANESTFFPIFPYAGWNERHNSMPVDQAQSLEKTAISPERRTIVGRLSSTNSDWITKGLVQGETSFDTTPSGLIAQTTQSTNGDAVKWDTVQLGWNVDNGTRYTMAFVNPPDPLVTALQSSDVFLVAANNANIGQFSNTMSIGSWGMQANIGIGQTYGDYRNVMIFKGRRGRLYNPDNISDSLIANPKKWTQSVDFAIPATTDSQGRDDSSEAQLVILSQWLQTYFENARQQGDNPYFQQFNRIAVSESWTGILFLRVDITSLPENLLGILAGVTAPQAFNAHHLAIEISPVVKGDEGASVDKPSSIFGLIYYVDPGFSDTVPAKSIAPTDSEDYNFRLLSLKVLFENTSVKSFESYAQLTLNKLFGSAVTRMGDPANIYKNVLLSGSLQINNGSPVYSLGSHNDDAFYFNSNIINKIEITNVLLSTRSNADSPTVRSWFGMTGFIDYFKLKDSTTNVPFDIFSFGNELGQDKMKQGLSFSNLGIAMSFPLSDPSNSLLAFDTSEIAFDLTTSTPRPNSLYLNMVLDMDSLIGGTAERGPKQSGYLDVIPDVRLSGVLGGEWFGLRFRLNMGTPGELAGKVNLNSFLLLSWSSESYQDGGYKAGIGISLPGTGGGASLISLQSVMTLSIGQIRLSYIEEQASFLLLFTEIALKFLGLLKIPPSGNTLFYLFGNPKAGGKASGLGWYAMYAQKDSTKQQSVA